VAKLDYFSAAYPEPWQILGVNLRPFSVGHYLKLKRLNCAFVADGESLASVGDLLLGVIICSMPSHPDAEQDAFWCWYHRQSPDGAWASLMWKSRKHAARLLRKEMLTPAEFDVYQFGKRVGAFNLKDKSELFQSYIAAHTGSLPHWIEPSDGSERKSGAHWIHSMISCLTSSCGYTINDAYNVSFGRALADYLKHAENNGTVRCMTEAEIEFTEATAA
jgi:hypothetical protein